MTSMFQVSDFNLSFSILTVKTILLPLMLSIRPLPPNRIERRKSSRSHLPLSRKVTLQRVLRKVMKTRQRQNPRCCQRVKWMGLQMEKKNSQRARMKHQTAMKPHQTLQNPLSRQCRESNDKNRQTCTIRDRENGDK